MQIFRVKEYAKRKRITSRTHTKIFMKGKIFLKELKSLGKVTDYVFDYSPEFLEAIENKNSGKNYFVKLTSEEFTCVCPVTHQPDFATIKIRYIPDEKLVESKSLKLYLTSFRNTGIFHEEVVNKIADDLIKLLRIFQCSRRNFD